MSTPIPLPSAEVCDRLAIDRSTLSRWVRDGRIVPVMRLGDTGPMFFGADDVEALRQKLTAEAEARVAALRGEAS